MCGTVRVAAAVRKKDEELTIIIECTISVIVPGWG